MTADKTLISPYKFAKFISSIPCWWLGYKGLLASFLPSKHPDILWLYSYKKSLALLAIILLCTIYFKFVQQKVCQIILPALTKLTNSPRHVSIFITITLITALTSYFEGISVGEDISGQVKSAVQYYTGKTHAPNFLTQPDTKDISTDISSWSLRPPGASLFPLIGLFLGMSIGQSIWFGLLLIALLGGIGWIKLAMSMGIRKEGLLILAIFLGLWCGRQCNSFGTMNCVLYTVVPWMTLWSKKIYKEILLNKSSLLSISFISLIFYILLGSFAFLKLSGLIVALTIGAIPIIFILLSKLKLKRKALFSVYVVSLSTLMFVPYKLIEDINQDIRGISSDEMYSSVDYNEQSLLWGKHFTESTRGNMLLLGTLGASGYAMSTKQISHSLRDFLLQFKGFRAWTDNSEINPHIIACGTFGLVCTLFVFILVWKNRIIFTKNNIIILSTFFILPFIGLSLISKKHGFNHVLYATHTIEYALILLFPMFILWQRAKFLKSFVFFGFGFLVTIPTAISMESLILNFKHQERTVQEKELGFSSSKFSAAISATEIDSTNELDIIYFLPEGDMSDLVLRTKMRTMAMHFAGGNFHKTGKMKTSKPLNVYCLYDSTLTEISSFNNSLLINFPQAKGREIIHSGKVIAEKITLLPSHIENNRS